MHVWRWIAWAARGVARPRGDRLQLSGESDGATGAIERVRASIDQGRTRGGGRNRRIDRGLPGIIGFLWPSAATAVRPTDSP